MDRVVTVSAQIPGRVRDRLAKYAEKQQVSLSRYLSVLIEASCACKVAQPEIRKVGDDKGSPLVRIPPDIAGSTGMIPGRYVRVRIIGNSVVIEPT
jgi:hypothetical protein